VGQKLGTFVSRENREDMVVLKEFIEAEKVTPVVDRAYALGEAADAIRYMREGRARGKVVITM
jgi:NADPH:quinone reductase-like Zn-dependent oxidoreductase